MKKEEVTLSNVPSSDELSQMKEGIWYFNKIPETEVAETGGSRFVWLGNMISELPEIIRIAQMEP